MDLFDLKKSGDFPVAEGHGYPLVKKERQYETQLPPKLMVL
jgi:hypothetical protein